MKNMTNDKRSYDRQNNEMRPITIEQGFLLNAYSSVLIKIGNTHVSCAVSIDESVPPFLKGRGKGWLTAEYGMLPCSTNSRMKREAANGRSGRTYEIQRLIGRSLRMMVNLKELGERTLRIDCDVINADGGTRTAAITGAAMAVNIALDKMVATIPEFTKPQITPIAAISVGIVNGQAKLDLDYQEDSQAEVDANFIMADNGTIIETQATAEGKPYSRAQFNELLDLAGQGTSQLFALWAKI